MVLQSNNHGGKVEESEGALIYVSKKTPSLEIQFTVLDGGGIRNRFRVIFNYEETDFIIKALEQQNEKEAKKNQVSPDV